MGYTNNELAALYIFILMKFKIGLVVGIPNYI